MNPIRLQPTSAANPTYSQARPDVEVRQPANDTNARQIQELKPTTVSGRPKLPAGHLAPRGSQGAAAVYAYWQGQTPVSLFQILLQPSR